MPRPKCFGDKTVFNIRSDLCRTCRYMRLCQLELFKDLYKNDDV